MNIKTLLKYWIGDRAAILKIVNQPRALWLGLIFVLSAGFAREYDAEDLLHEPWYLLIPLVASIGSSFLLYLLAYSGRSKNELYKPELKISYLKFLVLYWMTAPLAWLYAIPGERLFSAAGSVRFNLCLLGIVSLWRVLLITRVISVLRKCSFLSALFIVMLFADSLALFILYLTPLPVFNIMGGIHLSEAEQLILGTGLWVGFLGVITFPIWLTTSFSFWPPKVDQTEQSDDVPQSEHQSKAEPIAGSLWIIAFAGLMIWCFLLPWTQAEQQNRTEVNRLVQQGKLQEAVTMMSSLTRGDFPPHWDFPPHIGYGQRSPTLAELIDATITANAAPWVQELYLEKALFYLFREGHEAHYMRTRFGIDEIDTKQLTRLLDLLESCPDIGSKLATPLKNEIDLAIEVIREQEPEKLNSDTFTQWEKAAERLKKLADQYDGKEIVPKEENTEESPEIESVPST